MEGKITTLAAGPANKGAVKIATETQDNSVYCGCTLFFAFLYLFLAGAYCHSATHMAVT
jgi:hypothetical protein